MNGVIYRRRLKVKTPCINTYEKQMRQCEKHFRRITLSFPMALHKKDQSQLSTNESHENMGKRTTPLQGPQPCRAATIVRRKSYDRYRLPRRKSNLFVHSEQQTPDVLTAREYSPAQGESSCSYNERLRPTPKSNAVWNSKHDGHHNIRRKSRGPTPYKDVHNGVQPDANSQSTFPNEDTLQSLPQHQGYFIRALTTLAINSLTSSNPPHQERRASHIFYDRNIKILMDSPDVHDQLGSSQPYQQKAHKQSFGGDVNGMQSSVESSVSSDDDKDATSNQTDTRERINRLRNHLKCTGLGEPILVTVNTETADESKKEFLRLVRKVHRGLSSEKQERLRLKTHLQYEMSLMKGESFCEQQDQVMMRTASADLGDRDQQLLEEEMKDHLLQELKASNKQDGINKDGGQIRPNKNGPRNIIPARRQNYSLHPDDKNGLQISQEENPQIRDDSRLHPGMPEEEDSQVTGDALSGTLRSPLTRREMRRRVHAWVNEVEQAMGLEWKEKMRITYGRRLTGSKTLVITKLMK